MRSRIVKMIKRAQLCFTEKSNPEIIKFKYTYSYKELKIIRVSGKVEHKKRKKL